MQIVLVIFFVVVYLFVVLCLLFSIQNFNKDVFIDLSFIIYIEFIVIFFGYIVDSDIYSEGEFSICDYVVLG